MGRHCERQEVIRSLPVSGITPEAKAILDEAVKASRKLEVGKVDACISTHLIACREYCYTVG